MLKDITPGTVVIRTALRMSGTFKKGSGLNGAGIGTGGTADNGMVKISHTTTQHKLKVLAVGGRKHGVNGCFA